MNSLFKLTLAKTPKTKESQMVAYVYAAILIIFALCQLYTFDKFLILLDSFALPYGTYLSHLFGGLIVTCEVFALPFLLGMPLSSGMRLASMLFGWMVPIAWLKIAFWLSIVANTSTNIGFLGTTVSLVPGWWAVFVSIALGMLAIWASWGLWPGRRSL